MGHDAAGARAFANARGDQQIGLRVLGFRHRGIPRLPQCCYVIDIYSETQTTHPRQIGLTRRM
jgi:hypothetical protein